MDKNMMTRKFEEKPFGVVTQKGPYMSEDYICKEIPYKGVYNLVTQHPMHTVEMIITV